MSDWASNALPDDFDLGAFQQQVLREATLLEQSDVLRSTSAALSS